MTRDVQRGGTSESQTRYKVGVRGRKTDVVLPGSWQRTQSLEAIFSPPQSTANSTDGTDNDDGGDDDNDEGNDDNVEVNPEEGYGQTVQQRRGWPPHRVSASRSSRGRNKRKSPIDSDGAEKAHREPRKVKWQQTKAPAGPRTTAPARRMAAAIAEATELQSAAKTEKDAKGRGRPARKGTEQATETYAQPLTASLKGLPLSKSSEHASVRRNADGVKQTRSGRHTYKPVEYWRGERTVKEEKQQNDMFYHDDFVVPTIKDIVRVPKEAPTPTRALRSKTSPKARSTRQHATAEDELEEWEIYPGKLTSEIIQWKPEYEEGLYEAGEVVNTYEEIAISRDAIRTSDVTGATFRFAKLLTKPFMHVGVVDLQRGSRKGERNTKKMEMTVVVHCGKV
ncbi:hypothetical protein HIM_10669 [Hirsutella minnesotensis 3608]|nr:hypothetical protein HIM_10669 [Hirsutella minnesotensis 3608]